MNGSARVAFAPADQRAVSAAPSGDGTVPGAPWPPRRAVGDGIGGRKGSAAGAGVSGIVLLLFGLRLQGSLALVSGLVLAGALGLSVSGRPRLGVFLALAPGPLFFAAAIFAAVVWRWRMVSLASLSAAAALPLFCGFAGEPRSVTLVALVVLGFTVWKHRENLERILEGRENRLGGGGAPWDEKPC